MADEGETIIKAMKCGVMINKEDDAHFIEHAEDILKMVQERYQRAKAAQEMIKQLSVHIEELEARFEVRKPEFESNVEFLDIRKMTEEEIQKLHHRLEEVSIAVVLFPLSCCTLKFVWTIPYLNAC